MMSNERGLNGGSAVQHKAPLADAQLVLQNDKDEFARGCWRKRKRKAKQSEAKAGSQIER